MRIATIVLASVLATQARGDQLTFSCDGIVRDRKSLDEQPVREEIVEITVI